MPECKNWLSRRALLRTGLGLALAACCPTAVSANERTVRLKGALCARTIQLGTEMVTIDSSTGEKILDSQLSMEASRLASVFEVRPGLVILKSPDRLARNALAVQSNYVPECGGCKYTVMLGKTRILSELQEVNHRGWGGITVAGIMAHEFAHIYQFNTQYRQRLRELDDTVKPIELHADFLAGYHLGLKRRSGAPMDIGAWMDGAYLLGDYDYNNEGHHGTPQERQRAVREGYRTGVEGHQPVSEAAKIGYKTVREIMQINF